MEMNCAVTRIRILVDAYPRIFSHSEDSCRNELHPHVCFPRHGFIYPFSFLRAVAAFFRRIYPYVTMHLLPLSRVSKKARGNPDEI